MICLPTRFLERGLRLPLVGTRLLLRGWTNGARGPCWLRPPPTFPSPAFFYLPLEEGPALSWGRARAGLPPLCTAPREVGSPVRLIPLLRAPSPSCLCTAPLQRRGVRGLFIAFIYLFPPPGPRPEPVRVLCFNNFINSANLREGTGSFSRPPYSSPSPAPTNL